MNHIVELFYTDIVPGLLKGKVDCELIMNFCVNFSFLESNKFLEADNKLNLEVPTLVIKNKNEFNNALVNYVNTVLKNDTGYQDMLSFDDHIKFIIVCSFSNMGPNDFLDPVAYYNRLARSRLEMPILPDKYNVGSIETNKYRDSNIFLTILEDNINQECPYKCVISFENGNDVYTFQTIRFYILDNVAYIGAIQGKNSSLNKQYQSEIRRLSYKINEGVKSSYLIENSDPGACLAISIFTLFLKSNNITRLSLLPYGIIRYNNKKEIADKLKNLNINNDERLRSKITEKIREINFYFDNYKNFQNKLLYSFNRIGIQFNNCNVLQDTINPSIDISELEDSNNKLLSYLYTEIMENKKTNYIK